jgi:signal transduction histidine kinase
VENMSFGGYIKDRLSYFIIYFISNILTIIVMQLDRVIQKQKLYTENLVYALSLAFFILVVLITLDYARKRKVYDVLNSINSTEAGLQNIFKAPRALNTEHGLVIKILSSSFSNYEDRLSRYKEKQKEHIHFINQWVHQMKTPVSVINLILQNNQSSSIQNQAESIGEEVDKLSHGLEMILYTSRITDFEMDFKIEKTDILSVVRNVINDHKKEFIRYSIYPKITQDGEYFVHTDVKWIRFVINQIITNSIKYSRYKDSTEKKITVSITENNGLKLSILDDGVGMPTEDIPRVFNPFFTGSNGRDFPESTGMGMYLSKLVCNKLRHNISIDSVQGEWTRVDITFLKTKSLYDMNELQ